MAALQAKQFLKTIRYQDQQLRAERFGAHPDLLKFERAFVAEMRKYNVPFFSHCIIRTDKEQDKLFADGFSKARGGQSPHQHGYAVDLIHSTRAWELTDAQWRLVGTVGQEVARRLNLKMEWGGDWGADWDNGKRGWDPAHWQIKNWKEFVFP